MREEREVYENQGVYLRTGRAGFPWREVGNEMEVGMTRLVG